MTKTDKNYSHLKLQEICFYLVNGCMNKEVARYQEKLRNLFQKNLASYKKIIVENLYNSSNLPKDIAFKLASDSFIYAERILRYYPNFATDDLSNIIHSLDKAKLKYLSAIIARNNLPSSIFDTILDNYDCMQLLTIIENHCSPYQLELLVRIINKYPNTSEAIELLKKLPNDQIQNAYSLIDPVIGKELSDKLNLKPEPKKGFCKTNIFHLNENNLFTYEEELALKQNIDQLFINNRLLPTLMIHYLCKGNLYSFIYSITKITDLSFLNIRKICFEQFNEDKFKEVYKYIALPANMYDSINLLIQIIGQELQSNNMHAANFNYSIKNAIRKEGIAADTQEMRYLLSMM